tara:strand:+ start:200 stop:388 length:189 start_codon:yes stop_codon:yes gene_type:complete
MQYAKWGLGLQGSPKRSERFALQLVNVGAVYLDVSYLKVMYRMAKKQKEVAKGMQGLKMMTS